MTCKLATALCLALLLSTTLCEEALSTETSPLGFFEEPRCLCISFYPIPINPKAISELRLIEKGFQCNNTEMIAKLVDGREFCLDPMKPWVKKLVNSYLKGFVMLIPQGTFQ